MKDNNKKTKTCSRFETLITDSIYDELKGNDRAFFQAHLETCSACAKEYKELSLTMMVMNKRKQPEVNEQFWDDFLPNLQQKIIAQELSHRSAQTGVVRFKEWWSGLMDQMNMRWALYPAAALILIATGFVVFQYLYPPDTHEIIENPTLAIRSVNPKVKEHFENLRPVLIDYSNYPVPATLTGNMHEDDEMVWVDRDTLRRMVVQNHLLKKAVARGGNESLKQLLDDLEMILLEISNPSSSESRKESIRAIQEMMKENDVLFKMKVYDKKKRLQPKQNSI
jgi:Putative zinc-finger